MIYYRTTPGRFLSKVHTIGRSGFQPQILPARTRSIHFSKILDDCRGDRLVAFCIW
jgi:hypothetical protein